MEEQLFKIISNAIKEGIKEALKDIDLGSQTINGKDPNELLTIEQIKEETGFGLGTVQKMFKDKNLQVQRYTTPFKVTRQAFYKYINENHDYLSERS